MDAREALSFILAIPKNICLLLIKGYRKFISPLFPPCCRFTPTCSEYALISFQCYGFFKGLWLSIKRVLKCHPWHPGGYDPVP